MDFFNSSMDDVTNEVPLLMVRKPLLLRGNFFIKGFESFLKLPLMFCSRDFRKLTERVIGTEFFRAYAPKETRCVVDVYCNDDDDTMRSGSFPGVSQRTSEVVK
ncbi:hypothetical protein CDAR_100121 [Caerostris darwini]|uniref:Uncharacterized protein n=1 Tax=Caerostris darwini TaxID=1538125 RepID=A0AAV4QC40_9ARAC|nr:hypothetical protein CDAR_100121 [Caerostris darwini]